MLNTKILIKFVITIKKSQKLNNRSVSSLNYSKLSKIDFDKDFNRIFNSQSGFPKRSIHRTFSEQFACPTIVINICRLPDC